MSNTRRIILHSADLQTLLNCSDRTARNHLQKARAQLDLPPRAPVLITDYCTLKRWPVNMVLKRLGLEPIEAPKSPAIKS